MRAHAHPLRSTHHIVNPLAHLQSRCWLKQPSGWLRKAGQPDLTSGLVSALTVSGYTPTLTLVDAPLLGTLGKQPVWLPPAEGRMQGQCMVLPQSNPDGPLVREIYNTNATACCDACAVEPRCTVFVFCPEARG